MPPISSYAPAARPVGGPVPGAPAQPIDQVEPGRPSPPADLRTMARQMAATPALTPEEGSVAVDIRSPRGPGAVLPEQTAAIQTLQSVDLLHHPLQAGDQGDAVRRFKAGLALVEPSLKGNTTDAFDGATAQALKHYQTEKHLPADGRLDEMTMGILFHDLFWNHQNYTLDLIDPKAYQNLPPLRVLVNTGAADKGGQRVNLVAPDGTVVKQFPTSTGSARYPTPTGQFHIVSVTEKPWWNPPPSPWAAGSHRTPPGPNNPVGNVKMNVVSDVYLHGVPPKEYTSIGKSPESHGCMRMFQSDAWQLHQIIKTGTSVEIV